MPKYTAATEARSRTQRPGSLQEQPQDLMGVNVEPPVLASMTLANGETVYVELSSDGQRRMREGTIVELINSDVAARHETRTASAGSRLERRVHPCRSIRLRLRLVRARKGQSHAGTVRI